MSSLSNDEEPHNRSSTQHRYRESLEGVFTAMVNLAVVDIRRATRTRSSRSRLRALLCREGMIEGMSSRRCRRGISVAETLRVLAGCSRKTASSRRRRCDRDCARAVNFRPRLLFCSRSRFVVSTSAHLYVYVDSISASLCVVDSCRITRAAPCERDRFSPMRI